MLTLPLIGNPFRMPANPARLHGKSLLRLLFLLMILVIFVLPSCAPAQTLYGTLVGTVTDTSGAVLMNAKATIRSEATGVTVEVKTNGAGIFSADTLQPGAYDVVIEAPGFASVETRGVVISSNSAQRLNRQLAIGSAGAAITVTDAPPSIQTERADVSFEISKEQLEDLPTTSTTGRNFQSLYQLVPGATPPAEQNSASGNPQRSQAVNVNGAANIANSTRIDGTINTYAWVPYIIAYVPSQEAIGSVNFSTNAFTAEQGLAGGAAISIIIKSGTNKFHGSLFEYNQSTPYTARSWNYTGATIPKNMYNEFGGSAGGPILKNRLFFFFDFDRFTQRKTLSGYFTIPDKNSALAQGDFSGTGTTIYDPATGNTDGSGRVAFSGNKVPVTSVAQKMIALLPSPNVSGVAVNNFFATTSYAFDRYNSDLKIDYVPSSKVTLFGRYSMSPSTIQDPQIFGAAGGPPTDYGQPGTSAARIQNVGLGFTYAITPNFFIDSNGGYTRQFLQSSTADTNQNYGSDVLQIPGTNNGSDHLYGGKPGFLFTTGFTSIGNFTTASPSLIRDNQASANVNATWKQQRHAFRLGAEYTHAALNHFQPQGTYGARGGFQFTGGITALKGGPAITMYNILADFFLGLPQNAGKATALSNPNALRFSSYGFYAQDTFQVMRSLTLTYGLRYEFYPFATRDHSGAFRYDPNSGNVLIGGRGGVPSSTGANVGWGLVVPRFGVNYRLNDSTVIRSGFGMTVDPDNFRYLRDTYPATLLQQFNGTVSYTAEGCLNSASYTPLGGCANIGIPTVTTPNLDSGSIKLPATVSTNTIPQNYRRGYLYTYNLAVEHEFAAHFVATSTYVGSREVRAVSPINLNAAPVGTGAAGRPLAKLFGQMADISEALPSGTMNYNGLQTQLSNRFKRSMQAGIVYTWSHTLNVSDNSTYGTILFGDPAFDGRNYATAGYDRTNNLQFWSILVAPNPNKRFLLNNRIASYLVGGWRLSNILSKVSGAPFTVTASSASLNAPGSTQTADQVKTKVAVYGAHSPGHLYFDPTAFAPVTAARYGTAGRNSMRGPGYFRLDTSLFREFPVHENISFRFGVEAFDITNTPVFSNPGNNASSATLGYITAASTNRTLRLSGRLRF